MSAPHTPGPWMLGRTIGGQIDIDAPHAPVRWAGLARVVVETEAVNGYSRDPEAEANARLIAASPEMLGALEWIALIYESCDLNHAEFRVEAKRCVDAAIAKAKGEQA